MNAAEFRELGLLQEVNRRFLHPLGLALEVVVEGDGETHFGGVWDYRDDPEGIIFAPHDLDPVTSQLAVRYVDALLEEHRAARIALMGDMIQAIDPPKGES